jgi:putative DNA primase/helicase
MVPRPISTENITTAALFRMIELYRPTLLIDEADSFLKREDGRDNEELRGIMNAGHARGGAVIRTVGEDHEPKSFAVFGPIAFAWLVRKGQQVSETLADRSITIELRRKLKNEKVIRLRSNRTEHLNLLGRQVARWFADHLIVLTNADPTLPEELGDRAQDNWRPLLAIADAMPGDMAQRARDAALKIEAEKPEDESDASLMALADVAAFIDGKQEERVRSRDVVEALNDMEGRPWAEWRRGTGLTTNSLARLLKPFGIKPKEIRFSPKLPTAKGYEAEPIRKAKERYVDKETKLDEKVDEPEPEIPF